MGYMLSRTAADTALARLSADYDIYAPKRLAGGGRFSNTDIVRYAKVSSLSEIEFSDKSEGTFREALTPVSQTILHFTESEVHEPEAPAKPALVFLRSCDLHAVLRQDQIFLQNGDPDHYYSQRRDKIKFALIPCKSAFDSCFCVDMGTNVSDNYDFSVELDGDAVAIDCRCPELDGIFSALSDRTADILPSHVTETKTHVSIPEGISPDIANSGIWGEYDSRCTACGRCNFSCPSCTCYTMQDIHYSDNGRAGERRRVWASCMVDGFADVAGGGTYRRKNGERMRFKVLHKILDHKKRFGCQMCVGCGRCEDVCPEYISFANIVNKVNAEVKQLV